MKPDDPTIRWVSEPQLGLSGKMYLPMFVDGLTITFRHMKKSIMGEVVTVSYPDQEPILGNPLIYRGVHRLNKDEQGRRVFDGIYSHIAGIGRIFFNTPFAQPARTGTQHEDHDFPENWFPFSTATVADPLTGRSNVGARRMMLRGKTKVGINLTAPSDLREIYLGCVERKEKLKTKWAALEALVGDPKRLALIAADLVAHFEKRTEAMDGKAMVVAMSREICVHLYDAIIALRPGWHDPDPEKGVVKIIMTGSASDKALLKPHIYSKDTKKRLERRYKDPADAFKLVIVRDMWLTGFDAPCMHTMYVDKPMRGHNLMQAIARVNRVFKDKPGGLVVDYIGIANELKAALRDYTQAQGKGKPTVAAEDALAVLLEKMDVLHDMLHGYDYSAFRTHAWQLLPGVANHILGLDDGKKRFADTVLSASKAFALCCTLDDALKHRDELAFLQAVKAALTKFGNSGKKLSDEQKEHALRQIMSKAVVSAEVIDIFKAAGLSRPDIGILSDEFLEDVRAMKERNLAVELLERLLRDDIKSRFKTNVVQQAKFSELLQLSLQRYRNRAIETAQVIEELIEMAKKFQEAAMRGERLGLNTDEMAFYDALATNEAAVRDLGDATLKQIAVELTQKLRASVTVDWSVRETVRARLRVMVKTLLKRYKYPPDRQEEATETVLKQAEFLSEAWPSI